MLAGFRMLLCVSPYKEALNPTASCCVFFIDFLEMQDTNNGFQIHY